MIVRRIREHLSQRDWLAVGLDLVIAVLGVFIGIQVSNWNQARGERAQSREDRQRLIADLDSNTVDYANRLQYFRAVQGHARATLAAIDQPSGEGDGKFLFDAYQATQIVPQEAKHVTYDEIVATGRLTRLGAPVLRDRVGNYYIFMRTIGVTFAVTPPYRERLRTTMPSAVQDAIRTRCPERRSALPDGTVLSYVAEQCALGLQPAEIAVAARRVRAMPGLADELYRMISDATVKIELLEVSQRLIGELRGQIVAADKP